MLAHAIFPQNTEFPAFVNPNVSIRNHDSAGFPDDALDETDTLEVTVASELFKLWR